MPSWSWCLLLVVLITLEIPSGSSHGKIVRRASQKTGYQCTAEIKNCIEPVTSKICSGNGACVCGQCACFQTDFETYYGRFCEHCETCSPNLCDHLKPCVECKVHLTGPFEKQQDCEAHCSRFPEIQIAQVASSDEKDDSYYCTFRDTEGCEFYFVYGYDAAGHLIIIAEKDKECPVKTFAVNQNQSQTLSTTPTRTTSDESQSRQQFPYQQQQQKLTEFHRMKSSSPWSGSGSGRTTSTTTTSTTKTRPPPIFTEYRYPDQFLNTKQSQSTETETEGKLTTGKNSFSKNTVTVDSNNSSVTNPSPTPTSTTNESVSTTKTMTPKKILNTPAFDLMIVCGLTLTRNSDKTSQQPQYFQRNGIHFHIENCQFIPKYEAFIFTSQDEEQRQLRQQQQQIFEFEAEEQNRQSGQSSGGELTKPHQHLAVTVNCFAALAALLMFTQN